jgi:hypothetical protein
LPTPVELAATLSALVDVLIPGDNDFPSASTAGAHGLVFQRLRVNPGLALLGNLVEMLDRDGKFATADRTAQIAAVARLERDEPALFAQIRQTTYFSYYELPTVTAALRAIGHDYNDAPQPLGYLLPPFNPARCLPANPRGSYKATAEITRIDLTTLRDLELPVMEDRNGS